MNYKPSNFFGIWTTFFFFEISCWNYSILNLRHHQPKNQCQVAHKMKLNKHKLMKGAHFVNVLMEKFYVAHSQIVILSTKIFKKNLQLAHMLEVFMNILQLFGMVVKFALVSMEKFLVKVIHLCFAKQDGFHTRVRDYFFLLLLGKLSILFTKKLFFKICRYNFNAS